MGKNQVVIVTGGLGFIGSTLVNKLHLDGYSVINIDSATYASSYGNIEFNNSAGCPPYKLIQHDITQTLRPLVQEGLIPKQVYAIIHCAAESHVDNSIVFPGTTLGTNVMGTLNVLELARGIDVKHVVVFGTDEEYGDTGSAPQPETAPLCPSSPYSASKASGSLLAMAYYRTYALPVMVVRPCNNYGPRQHKEKLIPTAIRTLLAGGLVPLYGDGMQKREWLFVEDCVEAVMDVMKCGTHGETYNIGSGYRLTNKELVERIHDLMVVSGVTKRRAAKCYKLVDDRPGHDVEYAVDSRKIGRLGWEPSIGMRTGIIKTIKWYA